jgi:hypothetical protein
VSAASPTRGPPSTLRFASLTSISASTSVTGTDKSSASAPTSVRRCPWAPSCSAASWDWAQVFY